LGEPIEAASNLFELETTTDDSAGALHRPTDGASYNNVGS
jgi:hypothetical protein